MAQIFPRAADLWLKIGVLALLLSAVSLAATWRMLYVPAVGSVVDQTVPFSHKHHVGDDGIDCRYCHTSVETQASAGMPATAICMTCHSQLFTDAPMLAPVRNSLARGVPLRWNRVYALPDFVYFDHSIHVTKGIGCESCHGRVDQMPLMRTAERIDMTFCLDCHRAPDARLRPQSEIVAMGIAPHTAAETATLRRDYHLRSPQQLTNCSVCHR